MPAEKVVENVTYRINAVEIFSVGVWNGTKITTKDLDDMVEAFEELKGGIRPFLKFGHADNQKLAQKSGLPAVGWVVNLYRSGNKLLADFDYIPQKVFQLLQNRAYRKVSCEVYFDINIEGKEYRRVLGAVALLGAETPGVMNLDDILGQYTFEKMFAEIPNLEHAKLYSFENPYNLTGGTMPELEKSEKEIALEKEVADLKAAAEKADAEKKEFELKQSEAEKELETAKEQLKEFQAKEQAALQEAEKARKEAFCAKMEAQKLSTPGMKDLVFELLGESKKEYSIGDKNISREDLVEQVLKLANEAAKVNFTESSLAADKVKGDKNSEIEKEIETYMKDQKCDYASAHKAVMKKYAAEKTEDKDA